MSANLRKFKPVYAPILYFPAAKFPPQDIICVHTPNESTVDKTGYTDCGTVTYICSTRRNQVHIVQGTSPVECDTHTCSCIRPAAVCLVIGIPLAPGWGRSQELHTYKGLKNEKSNKITKTRWYVQ